MPVEPSEMDRHPGLSEREGGRREGGRECNDIIRSG